MIAIIGIIIFQVVFIRITWNLNEKQFTQSAQIALKNVANKVFEYNGIQAPEENPVVQLSSKYFIVNINSEVDANILEYYLQNEFDQMNLEIDFEYAIYNCQTDQMVYGNYIEKSGETKMLVQPTELALYDEYVYYFGINFPSRKSYLVGQLSIWTIFTAILLIVIIFFSYALFIILQQKRLSKLQKDFIDNMTHEFKTPISSVLISSDVLLNPDTWNDKERLQIYAGIVKNETGRLNKLIERVLQITRLEKKGFHLNKEKFNIHDCLKEVSKNINQHITSKNIQYQYHLKAGNATIHADKLHFSNLIFNLLDNANKYSGDNLQIELSTRNINDKTELQITDNGIGIDPKYLKNVFSKFFRVPTDNIHNVKGFGLGLYYVKNICKQHNWKINIESHLGKGTTFKIIIPSESHEK